MKQTILTAIILIFAFVITVALLCRNRRIYRRLDKIVKERTHELELQTQAAQVASKSKSIFLASMSHEIRTPLNAIIGMASIAKNSIPDPDKTLESINHIITASHHLLSILNDVLDMSKIESGKLELASRPFSCLSAYNDVTKIIMPRCLDKNILLITGIDKMKDLILVGDKMRIDQILLNLLGNAVKFTHEGGEINFQVNISEEDDENVKLNFSISDTGIGMTEEQMEKLFVPFEQTSTHVAAKFGGTGLGLSISQNLAGMMGGVIKVESKLGIGSKFFFDLRLKKGETIVDTSTEDKVKDFKGKKILLVEDIQINRIIIKEMLTPAGIMVEEAENGKLALEMFSKSPYKYYDLIFMDIQMPIMDGYEATKEIRMLNRPDAGVVPIIAMTANAYKEDIEEALYSGMDGHLPKPVDITNVMKTLTMFII
ncbi:MAG: response regulator [Deferribacteraceae bacterium]|jgi:signal transduction histidine kinase/CheY-like chemotaxis protein|nr:response regulator [Deferribacteraceae bacterium]